MIRLFTTICGIIATLATTNAKAKTAPIAAPIRVAIVENLKFEKLSTDKYASDYIEGLETARDLLSAKGLGIELQQFVYGKDPLAILHLIPEVKAWRPDLVIGPRSSAQFMLLKDQFTDVLVISPFATASAVSSLPTNFYSMTLPNEYFTKAIVNLVKERFPGKAVAPIGEVDCKNCMDFVSEFGRAASQTGITVRTPTTVLTKNAETASTAELLANYRRGDIILLPNTSYTSATLAGRISDHLKDDGLVFIGGDGWGDWSASYVGKVKSPYSYAAYRATPWSLEATDGRGKDFRAHFLKYRKVAPTGVASLLSYATLMAALEPLLGHNQDGAGTPVRNKILNLFGQKRRSYPNYARPTQYAVYRVTQSGELFDGLVSALDGGSK
jgi:hypothetical protein